MPATTSLNRRFVPESQGHVSAATASVEQPNGLARFAFYFVLLAIPFARLYMPGTGERFGVTRIAQVLVLLAMLSQPRVCLRRLPIALLWFAAYAAFRMASGFALTPHLRELWFESTLHLFGMFPLALFLFNILTHEGTGSRGLLALVTGISAAGALHILGIGAEELPQDADGRITLFGENANVVGLTYAMGLIAATGLLLRAGGPGALRWLCFPSIALMGTGLALTGSRGAAVVAALGIALLIFPLRPIGFQWRTAVLLAATIAIAAAVVPRVPTIVARATPKALAEEPRMKMFPVLWEMFLRHPIFGSGPDGYREELTWRTMPERIAEGNRPISAHHLALLTLVETGVVGFGLFAAGVAMTLAAAWRSRRYGSHALPLAMFLPLVIAGMLFGVPHYQTVFWVAAACAWSGAR